ncbi:hypothetical protein ACJQWK_03766 [Exserohilum turcicum]
MFRLPHITLALPVLHAGISFAQQYPLPVTYDAVIKSPVDPSITISYRHPDVGTCATSSDRQKQYTGYINLPPSSLAPAQQDYPINTFFWFVEAQNSPETAPLTIWLNGGPGQSSMVGLFTEVGPCEVVQGPNSSYVTQPRPWSWDRSSNMLFIDQPTQTGFSYDTRVNASVDFNSDDPTALENRKPPSPLPDGVPAWRFKNGTFASGQTTNTEHLTAIAAKSAWHFLQGFLSTFPQYNPGKRPGRDTVESAAIHLFAESYGGMYGPIFANFFEEQNERRKAGTISSSALEIHLGSVGVVDGILDIVVTITSALDFAHNNTYGIEGIDFAVHQSAIAAINAENGCRDLTEQCRVLAAKNDPDNLGNDENTNNLCAAALYACQIGAGPALGIFRSAFDWRVEPQVGPSAAYVEYLNEANVLQSIGAPVNFTSDTSAPLTAMYSIGDAARGTQLASLARLLDRGIKVALMYGDADLIGNWYGGQNGSLELARLVPGYDTAFPAAGYAEIMVNESYVGGAVRQHGNLSFSRIYDAGHQVPQYQPETAFTVFNRVIHGKDISTGRNVDLSSFSTKGPKTSDHMNVVPPQPETFCWIRQSSTCTDEQNAAIRKGQGTVQAGIWTPTNDNTKPGVVALPAMQETSGSPSLQPNLLFRLLRHAVPETTEDDGDDNRIRNGLIGGLCAAVALLL